MQPGKFRPRGEREARGDCGGPAGGKPARIGKYEVQGQIKAEKHARVEVFRAYDHDIGRPVTLKLVVDVTDRPLAERFRREVSSVAKLNVSNLVSIYELGEQAGLPFAAMQHLGDDNLGRAIQDNRTLHLLQKVGILEQVAGGV